MKKLLLIIFIISLLAGCSQTSQLEKDENIQQIKPKTVKSDQKEELKTLAILPFENNSITDIEKYKPLTKGISAMLTTDLKKNCPSLKLIERAKIQALIKEIALSQSGSIDASTAIQAGRMLGAQFIAFGSFIFMADELRIDLRIIKVETSEVLLADSVNGNSNTFMSLVGDLAKKIAEALKISFFPKSKEQEKDIKAALYFSQGLEELDNGNTNKAKELFNKCIEINPDCKNQVNDLNFER